jgi:hypothetical protein
MAVPQNRAEEVADLKFGDYMEGRPSKLGTSRTRGLALRYRLAGLKPGAYMDEAEFSWRLTRWDSERTRRVFSPRILRMSDSE